MHLPDLDGRSPGSKIDIRESLGTWLGELKYATRSLRQAGGFATAVVLTLALGLGANAALFAFLHQVFLRAPAGVASPDRVRRVWLEWPYNGHMEIRNSLAHHDYRALAAALAGRADLALYSTQPEIRIGRDVGTATATVTYATASYFTVLGVHAANGRTFTPAEADIHGAQRVAVLSDAYWQRQYGGDEGVIGRNITVDDREFTIIGIAPPGFAGVDLQATQIWIPLGTFPTQETARVGFWDSSFIRFTPLLRLRPGANEQTVTKLATTAYRTQPVFDFVFSYDATIVPAPIIAARGPGQHTQEVSIALRLAVVAVLILLITAANTSNLLLARANERQREAAVRLALGISRGRLARLLLLEAAVLAIAAAITALIATLVTSGLLRSLLMPGVQFAERPLGGPVVLFTVGLALATGIGVGVVPALRLSGAELTLPLKAGAFAIAGRGRGSRLPAFLVGGQAALCVATLVGAVLFIGSLHDVEAIDLGFDLRRLGYVRMVLPAGRLPDTLGFSMTMRQVGERLRREPGIEGVAFSRNPPVIPSRIRFYTATDSTGGFSGPSGYRVSSDYFATTGVRLLRGRVFSDERGASSSSVVVNEALAETYWPGQDPIGQCLYIMTRTAPCTRVVGVVETAIGETVLEPPRPQLYQPIFTSAGGQRPPVTMLIRAEPEQLGVALARASRALHDAFPGSDPHVVRMEDRLAPQYRAWRLGAALFGGFGLLALVVAALGIYGMVSYAVTQRTRELGVRIALGATGGAIIRHVATLAVRPVAVGAIVGAAMAVAGARFVASLLYGVSAWSPAILGGVMITIVAVGALAALHPAWRAAHVDPVRSLGAE